MAIKSFLKPWHIERQFLFDLSLKIIIIIIILSIIPFCVHDFWFGLETFSFGAIWSYIMIIHMAFEHLLVFIWSYTTMLMEQTAYIWQTIFNLHITTYIFLRDLHLTIYSVSHDRPTCVLGSDLTISWHALLWLTKFKMGL